MFTGIVEEIGIIKGLGRGEKSAVLTIGCGGILEGMSAGDSISVNGVCLTVTDLRRDGFTADIMPETMRGTNLGRLKPGGRVNLERAMAADGRFGGHIVSGHIDGTGEIVKLEREDNALWLTIKAGGHILRYVIPKGSIAVDGISLTVQHVGAGSFKVAVIPHTRDYTTLPGKGVGDTVNLECDLIGKYVEKLLGRDRKNEPSGKITAAYLMENGF